MSQETHKYSINEMRDGFLVEDLHFEIWRCLRYGHGSVETLARLLDARASVLAFLRG